MASSATQVPPEPPDSKQEDGAIVPDSKQEDGAIVVPVGDPGHEMDAGDLIPPAPLEPPRLLQQISDGMQQLGRQVLLTSQCTRTLPSV